jgi:hypothetical protein
MDPTAWGLNPCSLEAGAAASAHRLGWGQHTNGRTRGGAAGRGFWARRARICAYLPRVPPCMTAPRAW